jgi:hypothetical protein
MKTFTFSLMLLQQRADEALSLERTKGGPDLLLLARLKRRKRLIVERLKRSFSRPALSGN